MLNGHVNAFFQWRIGIVCLSLLCLFMLCACGVKNIQVLDGTEFNRMGLRLTTLLQSRGLLATDGSYHAETVLPFFVGAPSGEELYLHLSPAFRFNLTADLQPQSFMATQTLTDRVTFKAHGFNRVNDVEETTVTVLGGTDWNADGTRDWFVLCRISNTSPPTKQDYYLVILDTRSRPMQIEALAMYDSRRSLLFSFVDNEDSEFGRSVDVEAGQQEIIPPPHTSSVPLDKPLVTSPLQQ